MDTENRKETDLRELALNTLLEQEKSGRRFDELLHEGLEQIRELPSGQRSFYTRLATGTLENQIRLDHIIAAYSSLPVKKIRPVIRMILRMAVYQIHEMENTPAAAVVNEAVKLAEKKGFSALKGFVNGVLRNVIRNPEKVTWPKKNEQPVRYLSVIYSVPEYLAEQWIGRFGMEQAEELCGSFLLESPVTVHAVRTHFSEEDVVRCMEAEGVSVEKDLFMENTYRIRGQQRIRDLKAFQKGMFYVQDIGAHMAVLTAGIRADDRVLDVCAAPGGKSIQAADILCGTGFVTARDLSEAKIHLIEENIRRMRLANIRAEVFDALVPDEDSFGAYDVVIVDAPCTGYGVIGRKPDIKFTASAEKEEELAALQRKILHAAAAYVRPGGTLLYCTCTISEMENEGNADWFLREHPAFSADSVSPYIPEVLRGEASDQGRLQLMADPFHDGFFMARFVNGHPVANKG